MKHISAREVAALLGIKTATLARWRRFGRGPKNWLRLSATFVVYPHEDVQEFLEKNRRKP